MRMNTQSRSNRATTALAVGLAVLFATQGCVTTQPTGSHVYQHRSPSTTETLQSFGNMAYQLSGKKKGVTPSQASGYMSGLQALGNLIDAGLLD